jgi:hypothetical protein
MVFLFITNKAMEKFMAEFLDKMKELADQAAAGRPQDNGTKETLEKIEKLVGENLAGDTIQGEQIAEIKEALLYFGTKLAGVNPATAPVVTEIVPFAGAAAGGESVTINGQHFDNLGSVKFGDADATITEQSANRIVVTTPAGTGSVNVVVTTVGGPSQPVQFAYNEAGE